MLIGMCMLSACSLHAATPAQPPDKQHAREATMDKETKAADAALTGHYYLGGVMETGSELLLQPDGQFQWFFSYGAVDLGAKGRWDREGANVTLHVEDFRGPEEFPQGRFKTMKLRVDGEDLVPAWPWENGAERGRYSRE